jgi:hypothetical protein
MMATGERFLIHLVTAVLRSFAIATGRSVVITHNCNGLIGSNEYLSKLMHGSIRQIKLRAIVAGSKSRKKIITIQLNQRKGQSLLLVP